jgi:hypothetical protein
LHHINHPNCNIIIYNNDLRHFFSIGTRLAIVVAA